MELRGPHILLRSPRQEDAEALFALMSNPELAPFVYWNPHQCPDETYEYWSACKPKRVFSSSRLKVGPQGVIGLHLGWPNKLGETETWLGRPNWGRGINTEAKVVLFDFAFGAWDMRRIQAIAHVHNPRSQWALEKLGFKREGLLCRWRRIRG